MSQVNLFGSINEYSYSNVVFGVVGCEQEYAPEGVTCKSLEERRQFVEERQPQLVFMMPQSFVEFDNF